MNDIPTSPTFTHWGLFHPQVEDGRVTERGTHDELMASSELYRRMCARLSVGRSLDEPESVDEIIKALA